jgi:hypothetical protein
LQTFTATIHVPAVTLTARARRTNIRFVADEMAIEIPYADRDAIGEPWGRRGLLPEIDDVLLGPDGLWRSLTIGLSVERFGYGPPDAVLRLLHDSVRNPEGEGLLCRYDRPATGGHLASMLGGDGYQHRWLAVTRLSLSPFHYDAIHTSLRHAGDPHGAPEMDGDAALDMRSRVAAFVSGNIRWDGTRYWVRTGMPGVTRAGLVVDAHGQRLDVFECHALSKQGSDWQTVPGRVEAVLRLARRMGRDVDEDALRERLAPIERRLAGIEVGDDDVRSRLGHIVFVVFDEGVRSRNWPKDDATRALAPRIEDALARLAPYAALAALGVLRRDEAIPAMDAAIETALLLQRRAPPQWSASFLAESVAYCEEVVMPLLGLDPEIDLPDVF